MAFDIDEAARRRSAENSYYPARLYPGANEATINAFKQFGCTKYAEFGINYGDTALEIAKHLNGSGMIYIFDFDHNVEMVLNRIKDAGYANLQGFGCSSKILDSYNWPLHKLIASSSEPLFDYAFIDGAHTWNVDALTFFLVDRLLDIGGYIDFDDYDWSISISQTLAPAIFPKTGELYTTEQIEARQVQLIVDLLVKRNKRYVEVVPNKIYKKIAHDHA